MRPVEVNPAKLSRLFIREFRLCNVKRGETIAMITDLNTPRDYVAAAFTACDELGADIYEICTSSLSSWVRLGEETVGKAKGTLEALRAADMIASCHLMLFTKFMREVRNGGTRVLQIRDTPDMLDQLMAPKGLKEAVVHAGNRLRNAKEMRIISDAGTDLRVSLGEYPTMIQYGYADERGRFDHWGAGHVHTFPNEGSANGTVVIQPGDCVILPYVRYVQDRVKLEIRDGFIRNIEGGLDAKLMHDWLEDNRRAPDDIDGHAVDPARKDIRLGQHRARDLLPDHNHERDLVFPTAASRAQPHAHAHNVRPGHQVRFMRLPHRLGAGKLGFLLAHSSTARARSTSSIGLYIVTRSDPANNSPTARGPPDSTSTEPESPGRDIGVVTICPPNCAVLSP